MKTIILLTFEFEETFILATHISIHWIFNNGTRQLPIQQSDLGSFPFV